MSASYFQMMWTLLLTSIPTILQEGFPFLVYFLNSKFVSFLNNNTMLGGLGVGDSFYQIIVFGFGYGFGFGTNLLAAEASGSGDNRSAGLALHRSLILNWFIIIPSVITFIFSDKIFIMLGVVPELAYEARTYLVYLIIPSILFFNNLSLISFTIAFKQYKFPSVLTFVGAVADIVLAYVLAYKMEMGTLGIAIALGTFELIRFVGILVYVIFFFPEKEAVFSFNKESFQGLWSQFKFQMVMVIISLVICVMMEVSQIYSGILSAPEAAAQGLIFRLYVIFQTIPDTISYVTCSKISFYLGQGNITLSKKYVNSTALLIFLQAALFSVLWLLFKETLSRWLAGPNTVLQQYLEEIFFCLVFTCPIQSLLFFFTKQLRAFKPGLTMLFSCIGVLAIQLPGSSLFGVYMNLRLTGIWLSVFLASLVIVLFSAIFLYRVDFRLQSDSIRKKYSKMDISSDSFNYI